MSLRKLHFKVPQCSVDFFFIFIASVDYEICVEISFSILLQINIANYWLDYRPFEEDEKIKSAMFF